MLPSDACKIYKQGINIRSDVFQIMVVAVLNLSNLTFFRQHMIDIQVKAPFLDLKTRTEQSSHRLSSLSPFRLDTTLIDFTDMKCQRGDLSFIFNGDAKPSQSFVVLDNEAKVYQRIHHEVSEWHCCISVSHCVIICLM